MDLNHLHLHVRDVTRSQRFYGLYFGFTKRMEEDGILFLRNAEGFDLALRPVGNPPEFPDWFHFGFRLPSAKNVHDLLSRMEASGVNIIKPLYEEKTLVSFMCADPDGHKIQIYWED